MFGGNPVPATIEDATISPWNFNDRESDVDGDGVSLVREYDSVEPSDPWNMYSIYEIFSANDLLLPGTTKFTDAETRKFGIAESKLNDDDDNDNGLVDAEPPFP